MSRDGYEGFDTARLLDMFVELAKATPTLYSEWPKACCPVPPSASGVRQSETPRWRSCGRLRRRSSRATQSPRCGCCFEDDNLDVRAWATGQLIAVDPEWARASWQG